jgi:DNA repair exonuclease SbcCD ATPase subunit
MRMALLELLSPVRLMILDEPFGSLDKEHREALGEALNKIGGEGQLIIVTHIPVDSLQLPQLELGGY